MVAAWISFGDGSADAVVKILIQGSYQGLFHARVSFTNLRDGEGIWTPTHGNDEPVLGKLADAPVITDDIKHFEEIPSDLSYTFQLPLLSYVRADVVSEFPAHIPNEVESIITELFIDGLVKTAKAFHIARYGPMVLLLKRQSFELQLLGKFHRMSPIYLETLRQTLPICGPK